VVFDRNSGDYWVVSLLAGMVLEQFAQQTALSLTQITSRLSSLQMYADLHAALELTLRSLIDNDLIQNAHSAKAGVDRLN
jgi:hypothetical protein